MIISPPNPTIHHLLYFMADLALKRVPVYFKYKLDSYLKYKLDVRGLLLFIVYHK